MEDREFFNRMNVCVSLTRFVVMGQTYAMSGVTAVKTAEIKPSRILPIFLAIIGAIFLYIGGDAKIFGLGFLALSIWIWEKRKTEFFVLLSTSSGEVKALRSTDKVFISNVTEALNECIVARG
jgi:hypothetical protein